MKKIDTLLNNRDTILTDSVVDFLIKNSDYVNSSEKLLINLLDLTIINQIKDFSSYDVIMKLANHFRENVVKHIDAEGVIKRGIAIKKELGLD